MRADFDVVTGLSETVDVAMTDMTTTWFSPQSVSSVEIGCRDAISTSVVNWDFASLLHFAGLLPLELLPAATLSHFSCSSGNTGVMRLCTSLTR